MEAKKRETLIVVEGLDGSGKATQTRLLCQAMGEAGVPYRAISFPDYNQPSSALVKLYLDGEFGMKPEDVSPYAASSFYAVDRFASYRRFWKEDYQKGTVIVADRYVTSNLVYQLTKVPRPQWDAFTAWLEDYEYEKLQLPRPAATIYLDMPPEVSQELLRTRYAGDESKRDIHESNVAFLKACRETALYSAKKQNWQVIACASDGRAKSVAQIQEEVRQCLRKNAGILL